MKIDTKKMTLLSAIIAVAMILSYIESLIPAFVAIPGVKMGLSNIATVFTLYTLGWPYAICITLVRVLLSTLLFGNAAALIYSLFGAAFALTSMILINRLKIFSAIGVSVVGALFHNAGQILAVCLVMNNSTLAYYIFPLIISGTIAGVVIGLAAGILTERLKKHI